MEKSLGHEELAALLKERSSGVLERFGKEAVAGVQEPELLAVLEDVKGYWRDWFRPALTSFSCEAVGGSREDGDLAGLMFTLAAAGFGLHDDVLDKSSSKHFRRTIVGLHGADAALLAGDLLIFKGWTVADELIRKGSEPLRISSVVRAWGRLSIEVCEGEFMETLCRRNQRNDLGFYVNALWKVMAEIEGCCRIGAILGAGSSAEVEALAGFGRRLGFLTRLSNEVEDCLNLNGNLSHRLECESVPLPLLYAVKSGTEAGLAIKGIVEKSELSPSDVRELVGLCYESKAFGYILELGGKSKLEGVSLLSSLKPSFACQVLLSMISASFASLSELCV